jgi:hypothetical protein
MQSIYNFATKLFHCNFPQITYVNYDIPMYSLHCSTSLFFVSLYFSIDYIHKLFYFHVFIPLFNESFLLLVSLYFSTEHIRKLFHFHVFIPLFHEPLSYVCYTRTSEHSSVLFLFCLLFFIPSPLDLQS